MHHFTCGIGLQSVNLILFTFTNLYLSPQDKFTIPPSLSAYVSLSAFHPRLKNPSVLQILLSQFLVHLDFRLCLGRAYHSICRPRKPTIESNTKWIRSPIAEIGLWSFEIAHHISRGVHLWPPFWRGEVVVTRNFVRQSSIIGLGPLFERTML